MGIARSVLACLLLAATSGCREEIKIRPDSDAGVACAANERYSFGECRFVCARDRDCASAERCNLFTGQCEPKGEQDAGVITFPCTTGATRCRADAKSVEQCTESGTWVDQEVCPVDGLCLNETCLVCPPGRASCHPFDVTQAQVCLNDGSAHRTVQCAQGATCAQGECRQCTPGEVRCTSDGKGVETCQRTADETLAWHWVPTGDNFDGSCITAQCIPGSPAACKKPDCFPNAVRCASGLVQEQCSPTGTWGQQLCSSLPGMTATAECDNGVCLDECAHAAEQKSYFGCEYWGAVTDNAVDKYFRGGTSSGQGTVDSDFAFVVTNQSSRPAQVKVYRWFGGAEQLLKEISVPGRLDPATQGLMVIKVPWQAIGGAADLLGSTGRARYGYRLTSNRPITTYQFSPLDALKTAGACTADSNCTATSLGRCLTPAAGGGKVCHYYSYSNDASLLLPAHILDTQYVVMTPHHIKARDWLIVWSESIFYNSQLTVVATENNTQVTVRSKAKTRSGGGVAAISKGNQATYTLQRYEVLQLATDNDGANLECTITSISERCRLDNDLTGSLVTSNKPVAVFGSSACTHYPYDATACDHVEEQIFPFSTWGKQLVAVRSHPLRRTDGTFATPTQAGPDIWKIVASCSHTAANTLCPNGTTLNLSALPASADILVDKCQPGTSLSSGTSPPCRLYGGDFVEFKSKQSFVASADFPIAMGQFLAGQNATTGLPSPVQGDPSFILLPPSEQWRSSYTVLAAPGIRDNYLSLVYDSDKVQEIRVNGQAVSGFAKVGSSTFWAKNHPVPVGTHTILVIAKPGQTQVPGAGVTVYGFDSYVSYGYTGGLDLGTIVTGIDIGG